MSVQQDKDNISLEWIKDQLNGFADLIDKTIVTSFGQVDLLYIKSVADSQILSRNVITPFYEMENINAYQNYIMTYPGSEEATTRDKAIELCSAVIFFWA